MKVALYLRVSQTDEDPENQGREVRQFVSARGWETVGTYQDAGSTGARACRSGLDKLLDDGRRGCFEAVVVSDLPRLARSSLHALELLRDFEQMKVRLISIRQKLDTGTPLGQAFQTLAAMCAELERAVLAERVRAGMARAKADGKRIGRPARPVDLDELRRLRDQGFSIRQTARVLGIPSSTVAKRLASQAVETMPAKEGADVCT
jgi:DNA invertase Pin-like site-specific DNA recombinase